ncbi:MAG: sulfatase [Candidatus Omnitrophica bacterium]|nr:sulfatase [Candidatus Omnitrophota bacterium]
MKAKLILICLCLLLAIVAVKALLSDRVPARNKSPNLILISIDSLRADHLGCYHYGKPTSPNIDRLAKQGILFTDCTASSSWTLPSHVSMMTGMYPSSHGVINPNFKLRDEADTLAEQLKSNGYSTAAFVSGPLVTSTFGFDQGFDIFEESNSSTLEEKGAGDITSPGLTQAIISWLKKPGKDPFFLFLHFWDVHYDYIPPDPYAGLFDRDYTGTFDGRDYVHTDILGPPVDANALNHAQALYDGELRWVDYHVGLILDALEELDLDTHTVILLTSDHGDEFNDHGNLGHGKNLYESTLRVPLILASPYHPKGVEISTPTSIVDIPATLLDAVGVVSSIPTEGASILAQSAHTARPIFSELHEEFKSVRIGVNKGIFDSRDQLIEAYDLATDPREYSNLVSNPNTSFEMTARKLKEKYTTWQDTVRKKQNWAVRRAKQQEEISEQLRSLGYLH